MKNISPSRSAVDHFKWPVCNFAMDIYLANRDNMYTVSVNMLCCNYINTVAYLPLRDLCPSLPCHPHETSLPSPCGISPPTKTKNPTRYDVNFKYKNQE